MKTMPSRKANKSALDRQYGLDIFNKDETRKFLVTDMKHYFDK